MPGSWGSRGRVHPENTSVDLGNIVTVPIEWARHREHHGRGLLGYVIPVGHSQDSSKYLRVCAPPTPEKVGPNADFNGHESESVVANFDLSQRCVHDKEPLSEGFVSFHHGVGRLFLLYSGLLCKGCENIRQKLRR